MPLPAAPPYKFLPADNAELLQTLSQFYDQNPELTLHFPEADSWPFWRWVNVDACALYDEVRKHFPPVPPEERRSVVSSGGLNGFLEGGFQAMKVVVRSLEARGVDFKDLRRVLDFGCGCGRTLRLLQRYAATTELHGCDIDKDAIAWTQANLPWVQTYVSTPTPPIRYRDATFDLVYSISIFSHLTEPGHLAWIAELRRVVASNGHVILTTHGPSAIKRIRGDAVACSNVGLTTNAVEVAEQQLSKTGYAFCHQPGVAHDESQYGMTFLTREYAERHWSKWFTIADYQDAGVDNWQDAFVLKPR